MIFSSLTTKLIFKEHLPTNQYGRHTNLIPAPPETKNRDMVCCEIDLGKSVKLKAYSWNSDPTKIFVSSQDDDWYTGGRFHSDTTDVEPFIEARVAGGAEYRQRDLTDLEMQQKYNPHWRNSYRRSVTIPARNASDVTLDVYGDGKHYDYDKRCYVEKPGKPWNYLPIDLTVDGTTTRHAFRFRAPTSGNIDLESTQNTTNKKTLTVTCDFYGKLHTWTESISTPFGLWHVLKHHSLTNGTVQELWGRYLDRHLAGGVPLDDTSLKSLKKKKGIKPNLGRLREEQPVLMAYFEALQHGKTRDKTSNNRLLAAFLKEYGTDYDALVTHLSFSLENAHNHRLYGYEWSDTSEPTFRNVCLALPGAQEAVAAVKAKTQWQFRKTMGEKAEGLGITMEAYPLLMDAIGDGHIPLGVFHESGDQDHLINIEFDLWEKALERDWAEVLSGIAQNCAGRKKYTRQMSSYLAFLFKIERYLNKHAPRPDGGSWKAVPKYVESQWELEMDEASEEGTVKKRSALTPVADNTEGTIMVPYAAIAIRGRQVTYCYSHNFYVVEEGMNDPEGKGVFTKDLEVGLNGRDDYGLMWYTLTGSPRNSGYPTFLVIFERTNRHGTRVHFHRVHPSRKRGPNKTPTPSSRMIRECYRYMAGNVTVDQIHAQQGDMLFIKVDDPSKATAEPENVLSFESHAFIPPEGSPPVQLVRSVAKAPTNRLGYVYSDTGFVIDHPEHEPVPLDTMTKGWYEVRRCKSWEANPTAVWSITID